MLQCSRLPIIQFMALHQTFTLDSGSPKQQVMAANTEVHEVLERRQTQGGTTSFPALGCPRLTGGKI